MTQDTYFDWLVNETPTEWWHDSGDLGELEAAMAYGASGVTMNPVLANQALRAAPEYWLERIGPLPPDIDPVEKAQKLTQAVVTAAAEKLAPRHRASDGATGYVCSQVNP